MRTKGMFSTVVATALAAILFLVPADAGGTSPPTISCADHTLYLFGAGTFLLPLILTDVAPTSAVASFQDSPPLSKSGGNPWRPVSTTGWVVFVENPAEACSVADVEPLHVWLGLRNSDDVGTRFDLRAELRHPEGGGEALIASGEVHCVSGVARNPAKAKEIVIAFDDIAGGAPVDGQVILRIFARIGTAEAGTCPGHSSATGARVYYGATSRPARLGVIFVPVVAD